MVIQLDGPSKVFWILLSVKRCLLFTSTNFPQPKQVELQPFAFIWNPCFASKEGVWREAFWLRMPSPVDSPFCHLTPYRLAFGRQCVRTLICYSCQRDVHCLLFCSARFPIEIRLFLSWSLSDRLSNPILFTFLIHCPILVLVNTEADALMVLSSTTVMNTGSQIEERDVINACSDEKISACAQLFLGIRLY